MLFRSYIMELMNKIVQYTLWKSIIILCIVVVFAIILMKIYTKFVIWEDIVDYNDKLWDGICRGLIIGITCLCIYEQAETIITCVTFPEKVVIEYVQSVTNKMERR